MFRDIQGYEGLYGVSESGEVFSYKRDLILKPNLGSNGYLKVVLYKNGLSRNHTIHRLVAIAYVKKQEGLEYVNHLDGDKVNNNADNLEWCTPKENTRHAIETGLTSGPGPGHPNYGKVRSAETRRNISEGKRGLYTGKDHPRSVPVEKVDTLTHEVLAVYDSIGEAARLNGIKQGSISRVLSGGRRTTGGYSWRRA